MFSYKLYIDSNICLSILNIIDIGKMIQINLVLKYSTMFHLA